MLLTIEETLITPTFHPLLMCLYSAASAFPVARTHNQNSENANTNSHEHISTSIGTRFIDALVLGHRVHCHECT
jgi:hypothetical protein